MPGPPIIVSSAPGRAGIIGNPSDMYGGSVISCAIGLRATVTITPSDSLTLSCSGEKCYIGSEDDLQLRDDLFDVARAVLKFTGLPDPLCKISYESEVPMRRGLSGSTALLVALLQGIFRYQQRMLTKHELAETVRFIEYNYLDIVCGFQDAYMCVFGGVNYLDFRGKSFEQKQMAQTYATVESLNPCFPDKLLPFVIATTNVQRVSGSVHEPLGTRWLAGEPKVVKAYQRIAELARLGKAVLLRSAWRQLGQLMNENHEIQRELGGSGDANEELIRVALEAGAFGAKLAGAGKGGTIIALCPNGSAASVETALREGGADAVFRLAPDFGVIAEEMP